MRLCLLVSSVILLSACGTVQSDATDAIGSTTETSADDQLTAPGGSTIEDRMDLTHPAVLDLANRLGVDEAEIEIVSVESVTWPDGSLGCPEPGKMYTQAVVEGQRIVLTHAERAFVYHSSNDGPPFLCGSDEKDGGYEFLPPPGNP